MGTNCFIPALWRPRQVALWEFKASLTYIVYCSPAWTTWSVPVPPQKQYEQIHFHVKKQLHSSVFRGGHVKGKQGLGSLGGPFAWRARDPASINRMKQEKTKQELLSQKPPSSVPLACSSLDICPDCYHLLMGNWKKSVL